MCALHRRRTFSAAAVVEPLRDELLATAGAYSVDVPAYVFMPDHFHGLFEGTALTSNGLKCAAMFRQRTGRAHRAACGGRLWQEGFFDRVLRDEESTIDVARYIVANPIRAGLCTNIRDYPFLGSTKYSIEELIGSVV
jgi:REP element-mobilizing transposase RayT